MSAEEAHKSHPLYEDDTGLRYRETLDVAVRNTLSVDTLHFEGDAGGGQHLVIFDNALHGRVLALDGAVQVTTADEHIYHEMMAHVPLFARGRVEKVLIIGGGDGGVLREVLRHPGVQAVTLVEIAQEVIDTARKWMPQVSNGAFEDHRAQVVIGDGFEFLKQHPGGFDVILVDSTDPVGPSLPLFTEAFYRLCHGALRPGGVLASQNGLPFLQPRQLHAAHQALRAVFETSTVYRIAVPAYSGGEMVLGFSSDDMSLKDISQMTLEARYHAAGFKTRHYAPAVHRGAFALPPGLQHLLAYGTEGS
jgi:spermidine synthase